MILKIRLRLIALLLATVPFFAIQAHAVLTYFPIQTHTVFSSHRGELRRLQAEEEQRRLEYESVYHGSSSVERLPEWTRESLRLSPNIRPGQRIQLLDPIVPESVGNEDDWHAEVSRLSDLERQRAELQQALQNQSRITPAQAELEKLRAKERLLASEREAVLAKNNDRRAQRFATGQTLMDLDATTASKKSESMICAYLDLFRQCTASSDIERAQLIKSQEDLGREIANIERRQKYLAGELTKLREQIKSIEQIATIPKLTQGALTELENTKANLDSEIAEKRGNLGATVEWRNAQPGWRWLNQECPSAEVYLRLDNRSHPHPLFPNGGTAISKGDRHQLMICRNDVRSVTSVYVFDDAGNQLANTTIRRRDDNSILSIEIRDPGGRVLEVLSQNQYIPPGS